mmetsp:Transcript_20/g.47  ORF Transcript_20/g.47 Transcript_20/m.47 type:complete len:134 (+) Transcript_20:1-402(+)
MARLDGDMEAFAEMVGIPFGVRYAMRKMNWGVGRMKAEVTQKGRRLRVEMPPKKTNDFVVGMPGQEIFLPSGETAVVTPDFEEDRQAIILDNLKMNGGSMGLKIEMFFDSEGYFVEALHVNNQVIHRRFARLT